MASALKPSPSYIDLQKQKLLERISKVCDAFTTNDKKKAFLDNVTYVCDYNTVRNNIDIFNKRQASLKPESCRNVRFVEVIDLTDDEPATKRLKH
jgi:hypothetical protein